MLENHLMYIYFAKGTYDTYFGWDIYCYEVQLNYHLCHPNCKNLFNQTLQQPSLNIYVLWRLQITYSEADAQHDEKWRRKQFWASADIHATEGIFGFVLTSSTWFCTSLAQFYE